MALNTNWIHCRAIIGLISCFPTDNRWGSCQLMRLNKMVPTLVWKYTLVCHKTSSKYAGRNGSTEISLALVPASLTPGFIIAVWNLREWESGNGSLGMRLAPSPACSPECHPPVSQYSQNSLSGGNNDIVRHKFTLPLEHHTRTHACMQTHTHTCCWNSTTMDMSWHVSASSFSFSLSLHG